MQNPRMFSSDNLQLYERRSFDTLEAMHEVRVARTHLTSIRVQTRLVARIGFGQTGALSRT